MSVGEALHQLMRKWDEAHPGTHETWDTVNARALVYQVYNATLLAIEDAGMTITTDGFEA